MTPFIIIKAKLITHISKGKGLQKLGPAAVRKTKRVKVLTVLSSEVCTNQDNERCQDLNTNISYLDY